MRINFLLLELEGTLGSFVVMKTDPFVEGGMGLHDFICELVMIAGYLYDVGDWVLFGALEILAREGLEM